MFDFYGVLHPDTFWGLADRYLAERTLEKQQELHDLVKRVDLGLMQRDVFWAEAAQAFGTTTANLLAEKEKMGGVDTRLMDVAAKLKQSGVKTGIISNVGSGFLETALAEFKIDDYFDVLVESSKEGCVKPEKRIYEAAAERLGVAPNECVFFDDVQRNVDGAIAVGMSAYRYLGIASCLSALSDHGLTI